VSTVAQKLGIKAGSTVAIAGQPLDDVRALLGDLPDAVSIIGREGEQVDQLILAANGVPELAEMLSGAWKEIAPGGRLWVWYRKGANKKKAAGDEVPLHRDTVQALLAEHGMNGVTLISVDDTWSSMRVREL
jgi:hypothetical protein